MLGWIRHNEQKPFGKQKKKKMENHLCQQKRKRKYKMQNNMASVKFKNQ